MHALPWRADVAFLKAWPALTTLTHGDWQVRLASGLSRRANSANPLTVDAVLSDDDIRFLEHVFAKQKLPLIVRVPDLLRSSADDVLTRCGFAREGDCVVLHGALESLSARADSAVTIEDRPSQEWIDAMHTLQQRPQAQRPIYESIIRAISLPSGFAMLRDRTGPLALAYGAIDADLLCIESVITNAAERGKGHASRLMGALLHWAKAQGAAIACLQVEAANAAALSLYRKLGLGSELYRYHYRHQTAPVRTKNG